MRASRRMLSTFALSQPRAASSALECRREDARASDSSLVRGWRASEVDK